MMLLKVDTSNYLVLSRHHGRSAMQANEANASLMKRQV